MKKTLYGIVVAVLGAILGAGAMLLFSSNTPSTQQAATGGSGGTAGKAEPAKSGAAATSAPAANAAAVELAKPERLNWPRSVAAVGSLLSDESVIVRSEQAGRITALNFREGQAVKAGQVLVQLDDAVARAELAQAKANQKLAKAKFDRAVELQQRNFISGQAKDEADNAMRVADAAVSLGEAKLSRYNILAPFSGTVGLRAASVGDYVKDGQDIINLEKTDPIKVDFRVPELYQSKIQVGQSLDVTLDALPGKPFTGTVYAINPQLDAAGRAVVLRARMPNAGNSLKPGMFARVRLTLSERGETLVVPEQAVAMQGEEQILFRVVDGRALRTKVMLGQRREGKVEIVEGIGPDDVIVVAGNQRLRDGAQVRDVSATPGAAAANANAVTKS